MSTNELMSAAGDIGHRLCRDAIWSGKKCNWVSWQLDKPDQTKASLRSLGPSLYDGVSGICLFLAWLHRNTEDENFRRTIYGAMETLEALDTLDSQLSRQGFHCGLAGVSYALCTVGMLLEDDKLLELGKSLVPRIASGETNNLTLTRGVSGSVLFLLEMSAAFGDSEQLESARRLTEERVFPAISGSTSDSLPTSCGFAHGIGGPATALLACGDCIGNSSYVSSAIQALANETASGEECNEDEIYESLHIGQVGWCRGELSVGFSQLAAMRYLGSSSNVQIEPASWASNFSNVIRQLIEQNQINYSLCHGIGGMTDFLATSGSLFDEESHLQSARIIASHAVENFGGTRNPWPCGQFDKLDSPGLLLGTAGIGYLLLRLASDEDMPSVLSEIRFPKLDASQCD